MGWNGEPGSHRASPDESLGGSVRNMKLRRIHWIADAIGLAGGAVPFGPPGFLGGGGGACRNGKRRRIHVIASAIGLAGAAVPFAPTSFLASRTGAGEEPTR